MHKRTVLATRSSNHCERDVLLPEEQSGFSPARQTDDITFAIRWLHELARKQSTQLYAYFISLIEVCESVDRELVADDCSSDLVCPPPDAGNNPPVPGRHEGACADGRRSIRPRRTRPPVQRILFVDDRVQSELLVAILVLSHVLFNSRNSLTFANELPRGCCSRRQIALKMFPRRFLMYVPSCRRCLSDYLRMRRYDLARLQRLALVSSQLVAEHLECKRSGDDVIFEVCSRPTKAKT